MAIGLLLLGPVPGCGQHRVPPPPPGPAVTLPATIVPGDLDAVVRVDLEQMFASLGDDVLSAVENRIGAEQDPGGARFVTEAVRRSDTAWFAFRPGLAAQLTDNVLVLRGDYSGLDAEDFDAEPPWGIGQDLGGGWRRIDRVKPAVRAAPMRVYRRLDELLVFVSEAAIDGAELTIEQGVAVPHVEAPNEGAVSGAIRAPALAALLADRAPAAARLLAKARVVSGQLDLPGRSLTGELEVEFREPANAEQAAEATRLLGRALREQGGLEGAIVERLEISATGNDLVVRLALDERDLAVIGAVFR